LLQSEDFSRRDPDSAGRDRRFSHSPTHHQQSFRMEPVTPPAPVATARDAFVVVQRGAARLEVVPLPAGVRTTIGRAPTNRIVISDPKCSRQHCELIPRTGGWVLRDLESRNGVTVDGIRVDGDWELEVGQTIAIGACTLLFTDQEPDDAVAAAAPAARELPYTVIERKSGTRYDRPITGPAVLPRGRHGVAELFRLAQAMTAATDIPSLTLTVLDGLLSGAGAQVGAVLLFPADEPESDVELLQPAAIRAPAGYSHARFSDYLSQLVLTDREAVLAHDISRHAELSGRDSLRELAAESAICAPIRTGASVLGVIHLYSTDPSTPLDADQLEFTLAVADQLAGHVVLIRDRERLHQGKTRAERQNRELRHQLEAETALIGSSPALQQVRRAVERVAPTDATVLIRGESGVGKELVARAVHFQSERRDGPFVCVNCAALTASLLESELFGHEKGAFTGAVGQKAGKFEQADGGTLFLDEIGEMDPDLQAKFLRVLEGQAFERVGGGSSITVDVRVVTATNRNLEEAVKQGRFRSDLYFRLQVIEVVVPPLRTHPQDIPAIAQHFVERFSRKSRVRVKGFDRAALDLLSRHSWPGNVRELRNVIERAVILTDREVLTLGDLVLSRIGDEPLPVPIPVVDPERPTEPGSAGQRPQPPAAPDSFTRYLREELTLDELDHRYVEAALEHCGWNKSQAARLLGIERTTLDRRLKKYGLARPDEI
jgi:Nif-specific regulatory protein